MTRQVTHRGRRTSVDGVQDDAALPPSLSAPLAGLRRASPRRAGRPRESSATRLPLRLAQINTHSKHRIYRTGRYRRLHAIRWATSTGTLQVCASARGGPYTIGMKISKPHTSGHCLNRTRRGLRPCGTPTLGQYQPKSAPRCRRTLAAHLSLAS